MVGDFNTQLSPTDSSSRQKLNREKRGLNDIRNQVEQTDTYRISHSETKEYIFFLATHGYFFKINIIDDVNKS